MAEQTDSRRNARSGFHEPPLLRPGTGEDAMTPALIVALQDGTATNEMLAESRGWRMLPPLYYWRSPDGRSCDNPPDYLADLRLTLADIEAKGWKWCKAMTALRDGSFAGFEVEIYTADMMKLLADCQTNGTIAADQAALNIAYAKAQLAEQENDRG
jgi:hypothetical protein